MYNAVVLQVCYCSQLKEHTLRFTLALIGMLILIHSPPIDASPANQCAISLCGHPQKTPSPILFESNIKRFLTENILNQFSHIEPKLRDIFDNELDDNDRFIQAIKTKLQDSSFRPNIESWNTLDYYELSWILFGPYIAYTTRNHKPFHERITYFIDTPPSMNPNIKKGILSFAEKKKYLIEHSYTLGLQMGFYTFEEAWTILKNNWDSFLIKYRENKIKMSSDHHYAIDVFQDKISGGEVNTLDQLIHIAKELEDFSNEMNFFMFPNSSSNILATNFYYHLCQDFSCKMALQEEMRKYNIEKLIKELEELNKNREHIIREKMTYCQSLFAKEAISSPTRHSLEDSFLQLQQSFFSHFSQKEYPSFSLILKHYLNNEILFFSQGAQETNNSHFLEKVNERHLAMEKDPQENYSHYNEAQLIAKLFTFLDERLQQINPLNNINLCPSTMSSLLSYDGFVAKEHIQQAETLFNVNLGEKDSILLSPFTLSYPDYGKGILAHELSHLISNLLFHRNELDRSDVPPVLLEMRECLNASDGNPYKLEEDTSDLISYLMTKDDPDLYSCSLLGRSFDGNSYIDLHLFSEMGVHSHSASLLRLLREALYKNKDLSPSCQEFIDKSSHQLNNINSCL